MTEEEAAAAITSWLLADEFVMRNSSPMTAELCRPRGWLRRWLAGLREAL